MEETLTEEKGEGGGCFLSQQCKSSKTTGEVVALVHGKKKRKKLKKANRRVEILSLQGKKVG